MIGKWLELLKEIAPGVKRIRLLFNPQTAAYYPFFLGEFGANATSLAAEISATPVRDAAEIEAAVAALAREPGGGLIAAPDPFLNAHRGIVIELSERHRLPAIFGFRRYVMEGAPISYGPDAVDVAGDRLYVDRIQHPGNVMYLPGNRIAMIDFGMVGRLSPVRRRQIIDLLAELARHDEETMLEVLLDWRGDDYRRGPARHRSWRIRVRLCRHAVEGLRLASVTQSSVDPARALDHAAGRPHPNV